MKFIFDYDGSPMFTSEWRAVMEQAALHFADLSFTADTVIASPMTVDVRESTSPTIAVSQAFPWPLPRIDFRPRQDWWVSMEPPPKPEMTDLLMVTHHELHHVLGFGSVQRWRDQVAQDVVSHFKGAFSCQLMNVLQQGVPLSPDCKHWKEYTRYNGLPVLMDPSSGGRQPPTLLDWAGLLDIGWDDREKRYVKELYKVYLRRDPDALGWAYWWSVAKDQGAQAAAHGILSGDEAAGVAARLY